MMMKYKDIENAFENNDIPGVKALLISYLDIDPGDSKNDFLNALKFSDNECLRRNIQDFYSKEEEIFGNERIKWNENYYSLVKSSLYRKFSKERVNFLLIIGKYLFEDGKEPSNFESPKEDYSKIINNKIDTDIETAKQLISKDYYHNLKKYKIEDLPKELKKFDVNNLRFFKISKFFYNKEESILEKFLSVVNSIYYMKSSFILILNSDGKNTELYIGLNCRDGNVNSSRNQKTFSDSISGNFPGLKIDNDGKPLENKNANDLIRNIFSNTDSSVKCITSISSIPSLKNEEKDGFVQGIEKLMERNNSKKYSAVFIADPINYSKIQEIKYNMENLYTHLSPLAHLNLNFGENKSSSLTKGISESISKSISQSITNSDSHTEGKSSSFSIGTGIFFPISNSIFAGINVGYNKGKSESVTKSKANTETKSTGSVEGTTKSISNLKGKSENLEIEMENKTVKNILDKIQDNLKRLQESENFGFWNFAGYIISDDFDKSISVANNYMSIMRGNQSHIECSAINNWTKKEDVQKLLEYVSTFNHPRFSIIYEEGKNIVTPGVLINSRELSIAVSPPRKSVPGLPVMKISEFGRNVNYSNEQEEIKKISLGNIYHLRNEETNKVDLNLNYLTSHTFISGCTGSGKTNAILKILKESVKQKINFLVIEPSKGEYKNVIGGEKDVNIFGTNLKYTQLLKINPFSFPNEVHVLEHMDRLIEIFNACWPMYAAMPAILKESIEKAYIQSGWDIENSINLRNGGYPTFESLLKIIPETIKQSLYSDTLKSDYMGALVTRVKSLTNGLYRKIFSFNEIQENVLFDNTCIIDISRIGSMETKALLMGLIFLKLKEYRESKSKDYNSDLKHITVLEEAHNLLKRTSTEFELESANLQGKAVEMISNSIAEMRTFGEGFIIADQSPGLLDESVIRNTGTKIILKLPEETDKQTVGKSVALNDEQIDEISRLETGVAIVYQNNWVEPVMCKIDLVKDNNKYKYSYDLSQEMEQIRILRQDILEVLLNHRIDKKNGIIIDPIYIENVISRIDILNIDNQIKKQLKIYLEELCKKEVPDFQIKDNFEEFSRVCCSLIDIEWIIQNLGSASDIKYFDKQIRNNIRYFVDLTQNQGIETELIRCILYNIIINRNEYFINTEELWEESIKKGEILYL